MIFNAIAKQMKLQYYSYVVETRELSLLIGIWKSEILLGQSSRNPWCPSRRFILHDIRFSYMTWKSDILMSSNFLVPFNSYIRKVFDEYKKNLFDFLTLRISRVIAVWFRVQTKVFVTNNADVTDTHRFESGLIRTGNCRGLYLDWYTIICCRCTVTRNGDYSCISNENIEVSIWLFHQLLRICK